MLFRGRGRIRVVRLIVKNADIQSYSKGYAQGSSTRSSFPEDELPNPQFSPDEGAYFQKGWWDGFNNLEFDPGGQGLFRPKFKDPREQEEYERNQGRG